MNLTRCLLRKHRLRLTRPPSAPRICVSKYRSAIICNASLLLRVAVGITHMIAFTGSWHDFPDQRQQLYQTVQTRRYVPNHRYCSRERNATHGSVSV